MSQHLFTKLLRRMKVRKARAIALSLLMGLGLVGLGLMLGRPRVSKAATTLTVNSIADDGTGTCTASNCTLRDAISSAVSGDTINFSLPANSAITLTNGEWEINKNLIISGPGANLLTVQRSASAGNFRIFRIFPNTKASISALTIANGNVSGNISGGGIGNFGTLTTTNSTISGNSASTTSFFGGGIYVDSDMVTITDSTILKSVVRFPGNGSVNVTDS